MGEGAGPTTSTAGPAKGAAPPREAPLTRARIQAAANDVAGALRTWQDTLDRHPQAAEAERMAVAMRQTFVDALLAENGVEVPP